MNKKIIFLVILILFINGCKQEINLNVKNCTEQDILSADFNFSTTGTGSMHPTLKGVNLLYAKRIQDKEELNIGDIIKFNINEKYIVHRINNTNYDVKKWCFIKNWCIIKENWYTITKGDNNTDVDPYKIRFENIIGKVICQK